MDYQSYEVSLREQFNDLQEQQKQRYRKRRTRVGDGTSSDTGQPRPKSPGAEDRLELFTATEELGNAQPTSSGLDPRETELLRNEVERLRETLKQKDLDISKLHALREEERAALGGCSSTATQRIVELSKRNREITAELTAEKSQVRKLQRNLRELLKQKKETDQTSEESLILAKLQEQLLQEKRKVTESRNQAQLLRQDLKLAHRVLTKEVGDGVSVSALLSGVSGWRGRAQQIASLQNKLAELKQQVQRPSKIVGRESGRVDQSSSSRVEARQKATLEKLEKERAKNLEGARVELEHAQADCAKAQQQCQALKARNKVLSEDIKSLKSQLAMLQARTPENDRVAQVVIKPESTSNDKKGSEERDRLRRDNQALQHQLAQCRLEIQLLKQNSSKQADKSEPPKTTSIADTAEPHSTSNSLPPIINPRPPPGRPVPTKWTHRQSLVQPHARKSMSAGNPNSHDQVRQQEEAHALTQVAQVERDRLFELTTALQQRLDASTDRMMRMETDLRNQRQQIARLEKQIGRRQQKPGPRDDSEKQHHDSSELESELALQLNENAVLRETLELTRQEKMEDIKVFHSMLQETKQLFIGSVRKMQSSGN